MSANRLFVVCSHHPAIEDAFCIGDRAVSEGHYTAPSNKRMDDWYLRHMACGRGVDHFQLAYHRPQDHDLPTAADPIKATVRLEIAKSGLQ